MASFGNQPNHEVRSLKLKELLAAPDRLAHLATVPVVMTNYRISESLWFGTCSISQRLPDVEPCSAFETLGSHLKIPLSLVESTDMLVVSAMDARAILRALQD